MPVWTRSSKASPTLTWLSTATATPGTKRAKPYEQALLFPICRPGRTSRTGQSNASRAFGAAFVPARRDPRARHRLLRQDNQPHGAPGISPDARHGFVADPPAGRKTTGDHFFS